MLPFQALKVSLCMWKCTRTLPFPTHRNFETQITLCDRQSGIERSATDQPLSVIHHSRLSLTLSDCKCVRGGAYEKCVSNLCLSVVWNKTVNSSSSYKGEIIFFHAHLALSLSLSLSVLLHSSFLSCSQVTLWLIVLSCQAHSAPNFLSQWHLSHSISISNTLPPPSTDQHKRAPFLVTRPRNRNEESC